MIATLLVTDCQNGFTDPVKMSHGPSFYAAVKRFHPPNVLRGIDTLREIDSAMRKLTRR